LCRQLIIYDENLIQLDKIMDEQTVLPAVVRLGLPGLPNLTDSLVTGGLYVLIAETASARFPILSSSLSSGLNNQLQCRVILPQNPEVFIQRLEAFGTLNVLEAIESHQLHMFLMQDEFSKKLFRYGAEAFVQELEHFDTPVGSYLLFDQADDLLSLHDVVLALDQVEILRKWAQKNHITILLVLTRTSESNTSTINALMDNLTGIARLGASRSGLELSFDYWQSPEGTIAGRNFLLTTLDSGLYEASSNVASSDAPAAGGRFERVEAVDENDAQFFYMDPNLGSLAKQMHGKWQRVDTLVGMMHATRNVPSATCILLFQRESNLRQLAETVHTLRLSLGRYARLVVQEKDASLRYQNEALLLKLGLNLVVNRDVPISRLPLLLESLKGQIFNRDVDINFEAALSSVLPTRLRGYLQPQRFAREVDLILERAETLNVPCALIVANPSPGVTISDLVVSNSISRPGDLISADNDECFVFLNACPQTVLLVTLERIFGMPVDTAFANVRFVIEKEEIQTELAALIRASERENLPDYTEIARVSKPADQAVADASVDAAQDAEHVADVASLPIFVNQSVKSPVKTEVRKLVKPIVKAPIKQDSLDVSYDAGANLPIFQYGDTTNVRALGTKEVPRATRAIPVNR
jgi:cellulose biosynthesis protein BcsE